MTGEPFFLKLLTNIIWIEYYTDSRRKWAGLHKSHRGDSDSNFGSEPAARPIGTFDETAFSCFLFFKMPKTKQQKKEIVDKIAEKIKKAKVLVFTSFSQRGKKGLNFSAMEQLKRNLKKADAEFVVLKKTLLNLALKNLSLDKEINMDHFEGSAAALFGYSDIIQPDKILHK